MTPITPENLAQRGYRLIEWNRGVMWEYWKSFHNGDQDFRVGVWFGEHKDFAFRVWLTFPNMRYAIKHLTSIEEIEQLLALLGGA